MISTLSTTASWLVIGSWLAISAIVGLGLAYFVTSWKER